MSAFAETIDIEHDVPISTWFRIGGSAERLARPQTTEQLLRCLEIDSECKVLGEGANLLVDDDGVRNLVVSMQTDGFKNLEIDQSTGVVRVGAGAALPRLITQTVNAGLSGLQGLAGFPATIGGACVMNAGGKFGTISDHLIELVAVDRAGRTHELKRSQVDFGYRSSGLNHLIITQAIFQLEHADTVDLKKELTKCMEYKTNSQPMSARSAGCAFKNPILNGTIDWIGDAGDRVSAGMLIDHAHCKGISVGGAAVSEVHANFITTTDDAQARDVIALMDQVRSRVHDTFGVHLENEVVVWSDELEGE